MPLCILYSKIVTTEKMTLSRETVEELQRPQAGDKTGPFLKRRLYRCNAPNIYFGIKPPWDSIKIVVQEKKRGGGGYGVVSVFDHRTRELQISRYRLKYFPDTLAMLQRVVCTTNTVFDTCGPCDVSFECDADDEAYCFIHDFLEDRGGWKQVLAQIRGE